MFTHFATTYRTAVGLPLTNALSHVAAHGFVALCSFVGGWAKRKEEQRFEEAKEEEGSRKQKDMDPNSGDKERTSLLNDKAVAMGLVSKKAVTDLNSIRRIYMDFDADGSGLIEPPEFMPLLSKLLRRKPEELDKREVWAVWDQVDSDGSGTIDFDEFQRWYAELMGIDILDYGEKFIPEEISGDQIMVRNVAKNLNRSILEVEKLYDEFKKLDTDNSNTLEMNEFRILIQKEFAPKGPEAIEN
ncbi:Probable calcium-binding protein CML16 (Calmodulin-like protein 16) [Durusdinium trenchii]|uniref:Probable calcium-binding protein CML16 (Calmodulin-like protein 16) n=1 Tax=Durusdinium trenchii TaxID=1381693 RepID=A0ABP0R9C9_9DINO